MLYKHAFADATRRSIPSSPRVLFTGKTLPAPDIMVNIELYQLDFKRIIECRVLLAHVTLKAHAALKVEGRLGNLIRNDCPAWPGSLILNEGRVRHVERRQRTG